MSLVIFYDSLGGSSQEGESMPNQTPELIVTQQGKTSRTLMRFRYDEIDNTEFVEQMKKMSGSEEAEAIERLKEPIHRSIVCDVTREALVEGRWKFINGNSTLTLEYNPAQMQILLDEMAKALNSLVLGKEFQGNLVRTDDKKHIIFTVPRTVKSSRKPEYRAHKTPAKKLMLQIKDALEAFNRNLVESAIDNKPLRVHVVNTVPRYWPPETRPRFGRFTRR